MQHTLAGGEGGRIVGCNQTPSPLDLFAKKKHFFHHHKYRGRIHDKSNGSFNNHVKLLTSSIQPIPIILSKSLLGVIDRT